MSRQPPDLAQSPSLDDEQLHFVRLESLEIAAHVDSDVNGMGTRAGHGAGKARPGGIGGVGLTITWANQAVGVVVRNISIVDVPSHPAFVQKEAVHLPGIGAG